MIPNDPAMLLSFVNVKLRDQYSSLEALCDDLELEEAELREKLAAGGWHYDAAQNRFA